MLTREALPSYIGLFLLCVVAAVESLVAHANAVIGAFGDWVPIFATLLIAAAIWISFRGSPSPRRSLPSVYENLKSGHQQPSTVLQKINLILGIALMALVWTRLLLY